MTQSIAILFELVDRFDHILSELRGSQVVTNPSDLDKGEAWLAAKHQGIQIKDLARKECVSPAHVYNLLTLARLPNKAKTILRKHRLSYSQVKPYLKLPITQLMKKLRGLIHGLKR